MTLHEHPEAFRDAIVQTAQQFQLPEIYVEKDYWVTLALKQIAHSPLAAITIFKGLPQHSPALSGPVKTPLVQ